MLRFIVRRLLQAVLVMFIVSALLFAWLRSLPGGPVDSLLGERATPASRAALSKQLGMDQPLLVQYWHFLDNMVHGRFGTSTQVQTGADALHIFFQRLPATVELSIVAIVIALATAIPLGYFAAKRHGGLLDTGSVVLSLIGVAVPVFFLAFVLKYVFAIKLGWLPPSGRQSADLDATRVTNFYVLDGLLTREYDASWDAIKHLILPAIALASIPFAVIFRITRASVLEVLHEDYVRTAESKGLTARIIRGRHVLHNAMLPVVTTIGLQVGGLLTGAVLTETVFAYPGLGDALAQAFSQRDYSVLQVLITMAALGYVLVNLLVDIAYAIIDPRIRTR
ncbi:ABC transporter permease [Flexivirga caeni]|uniref:ABC transporter permease n=1 Tax=Flexivirga caeni TaxID=2294115 RepID=A0A3M9M2X2_9MICO|nr:ABC transporter permease [Flexivirga caeni]RNI19495.1 ABC transporter permease [Flexivirga caeni]